MPWIQSNDSELLCFQIVKDYNSLGGIDEGGVIKDGDFLWQ